jgi:hypothetical protein
MFTVVGCIALCRSIVASIGAHPPCLPFPQSQETFEELYDVVYWLRQALGLALGLLWGLIPMRGVAGFVG